MLSPKNRKAKGARFEREVRDKALAAGYSAERVPWQPGRGKRTVGDVVLKIGDRELPIECKAHDQFNQFNVYNWVEEAPIVCVKSNHKKPLIIIAYDDWLNPRELLEQMSKQSI